jgi:Flp pilus assembly protein TadG
MVVLLGFLGLGIDLGYLRMVRRQVQGVADAAALAAAEEFNQCTSAGTLDCAAMTSAAQEALTENNFTGSALYKACAATSGNLTLTVNNPPCYMGSTAKDKYYHNTNYVETVVSEKVSTYFSRIFGVTSETVTARAEATLPSGGTCTYTTGSSGTDMTLVVGIYSTPCGVMDESSSSNAFQCAIDSYNAPYIGVVGNQSGWACFFPGAHPSTGIPLPNPPDPLAYLQAGLDAGAPGPAACGTSTSSPYTGHSGSLLTITSAATLNPGTYCGGIKLGPGANVTFTPGIYTLTSTGGAGGLSIDAGTTVTGNGVGFYNYGPSGGVDFLFSSATPGNIALTAPNSTNCSGCAPAWQGILFYQDPGNTTASIVVGSASFNTSLIGTSYFPQAQITYALDFDTSSKHYNDVVAKSIFMGFTISTTGQSVNTYVNNNFSELSNGNPIKSTISVLAE